MLHVLTHNILPVFAILAIGFAMGRRKTLSTSEAKTVNRVAFLTLQPPLIFGLLSGLDLTTLRFDAILIYALCEIAGFILAYGVARYLLRRDHLESWLLAMAVVFVNSLLYIWPIAVLMYGDQGAIPITAIVALDSSLVFAFFIVSMELMAGRKTTVQAAKNLGKNPILLGITLAITLNVAGFTVPEPIMTAARFAGVAAAPLTLLALGVILSQQAAKPSLTVITFTSLKLFAFPAMVYFTLQLLTPGSSWEAQLVLNAAGPSGAMAFSLALLHGVRTDAVAPVVIWTSFLSVFSLAFLA